MKLTCKSTGPISTERCYELLNRHDRTPGDWFECSEEFYWYMLEVLPPAGFIGDSFAMIEFTDFLKTHSFHKLKGRYFCALIEVASEHDRDIEQGVRECRLALRKEIDQEVTA